MSVCDSGHLPKSEYPRWRVKILNPACPSRKGTYREQYNWPALRDGMTVKEWDVEVRKVDPRGPLTEGVPTPYPCECVKNGYIALEPVEPA